MLKAACIVILLLGTADAQSVRPSAAAGQASSSPAALNATAPAVCAVPLLKAKVPDDHKFFIAQATAPSSGSDEMLVKPPVPACASKPAATVPVVKPPAPSTAR